MINFFSLCLFSLFFSFLHQKPDQGQELETGKSYNLCTQNISPINLFVTSGCGVMLACIVPTN